MTDNYLIDRVHYLEERIRFWKGVALGLAGALAFILAAGALASVLLLSRASAQVERAMHEAQVNEQRARQAMQEAELQRQRAEQEAMRAKAMKN